jgi:hypothetical protein
MTFDIDSSVRSGAYPTMRPRRMLPIGILAGAFIVAGCTTSHPSASSSSSSVPSALAAASGVVSDSPTPDGSAGAVLTASGVASPASTSDAGTVASIAPTQLTANIEAPATKAGFSIRVHRGQILKVNAPQAKPNLQLTFALDPAATKALTPIPNANGFYTGAVDGVVTVKVSQAGAVVGTIAVTVWG